ncbi:hypothetical protein D9M71_730730 [compost metagenome]
MAFCYMGADKVPSAIISIIYGTSPLVSGLISSFLLGRERFSAWQWLGLGIALVGMSFTLGLSSSGFQLNRIGIMLELIAMLFYVLSTFAVKSVGATYSANYTNDRCYSCFMGRLYMPVTFLLVTSSN